MLHSANNLRNEYNDYLIIVNPAQTLKQQIKIHRFSHDAMATVFEILIAHDDERYAKQAAHEAFQIVDKLEQDLSRFIENSDISRINRLKSGEKTRVGGDTYQCLIQCVDLYAITGGYFDVSVGHLMEAWLDDSKHSLQPSTHELELSLALTGLHHLQFDDTAEEITVLHGPVHLDLGGIGKGYAVDSMSLLLQEWELRDYFIHGGRSSLLANGNQPGEDGWQVAIQPPDGVTIEPIVYMLHDEAMSSSGLEKGQHIINPYQGKPIAAKKAAWAVAASATNADALSTAFMLMPMEKIEQFIEKYKAFGGMLIEYNEKKPVVHTFGQWYAEPASAS
ncbi:FAD:protein FMN transferase [candidate division KSB1 bacterium]|nr:FAD:protein FMN transferase [candidate division KSB1 bacterium]